MRAFLKNTDSNLGTERKVQNTKRSDSLHGGFITYHVSLVSETQLLLVSVGFFLPLGVNKRPHPWQRLDLALQTLLIPGSYFGLDPLALPNHHCVDRPSSSQVFLSDFL